jgi:hypothetical protein
MPRHVKLSSPWPLRRLTGALRLIVIVALLSSCLSFERPTAPPAPVISFTELKNSVVQIRGLALKHDIRLDTANFAGGAGASDQALTEAYGPATVTHVARAYKRIGLLAENTDFASALADYRRLDRVASYEAQTASVGIGPEASTLRGAFSESNARIAGEVPAVFAVMQALQEQHFRWHERIKSIGLEDRKLTFLALATGDATLVALTRASGNPTAGSSASGSAALDRLASAVEKSAANLPELLRWKLVFPYRHGTQFVSWAHATRGWNGVNALFSNPPLSTSQILHPEKYYVHEENPLRIFPWGLARRMKEKPVLEQTVGEYLVRLLLSTAHSKADAAQLASGWQGDLLSAFQEGDSLATAWISSWKTDKQAHEFLRAYAGVLERFHRFRFEAPAGRNGNLQADFSAGRSMLLQVKGPMVLLLDGMPLAQALETAQETWKELETEKESTVIPFDLGRGTFQLGSIRR